MTNSSAAPLAAEEVTVKRGGVRVLDRVSFTAGPGCLMGVVGPNGAGKSTLFNAIVGLLALDEGRVLIHGKTIHDSRGLVAYVPQYEKVNWRIPMSVHDVVMLGRSRKSAGCGVLAAPTPTPFRTRWNRSVCGTAATRWWRSFQAARDSAYFVARAPRAGRGHHTAGRGVQRRGHSFAGNAGVRPA